MTERALTAGEVALARSVFGDSIDYGPVRLHQRKWAFFQPRRTVMAPDGHIWFHPQGDRYCDDFCAHDLDAQGLFIHEMTHVWQRQKGVFLPLRRHPFCRYDYALKPGWPLDRYGIEQQAEIVRHAFLLREGQGVAGAPALTQYHSILPFKPQEEPVEHRSVVFRNCDSLFVTIPEALVDSLGLRLGDEIEVQAGPDQTIILSRSEKPNED